MIYVTCRLQFLLFTQRTIESCLSFNWALWPSSKERLVVLGAWGQPPKEVAVWSPGMGLPDALGAARACTSLCGAITGTCRTGHR